MKSKLNYAIGFNGANIIYLEEKETVKELIDSERFIPIQFSVTLSGNEVSETLIIEKTKNVWVAKLENSDVLPLKLTHTQPITAEVIWYALADQKEQLRHLLYILKQSQRENRPYELSRKAAGKMLVA